MTLKPKLPLEPVPPVPLKPAADELLMALLKELFSALFTIRTRRASRSLTAVSGLGLEARPLLGEGVLGVLLQPGASEDEVVNEVDSAQGVAEVVPGVDMATGTSLSELGTLPSLSVLSGRFLRRLTLVVCPS